MRVRHSFSSRHTGKLQNIRKQKGKYPLIAKKIIENSDIILEILDARFPQETRNIQFEEEIKQKGKKIIYVLNKSDLIINKKPDILKELFPYALVSVTSRKGIKDLRNKIKIEAKKISREKEKDFNERVIVGIIGYPNTGKSSLINSLIGRSSAGVGSDAGFTKNLQKIKLSENIVLIDSPGIIPEKEYSSINSEKISRHTKLGARSYSQVKEPEIVIADLMKEYSEALENFYKIDAEGDSEKLIEELGKRKGFRKKGGEVDEDKTSRIIIKDWQSGRIRI